MAAVKRSLPTREPARQPCAPESDGLAAARGVLFGLGVGVSAWAGIIVVAVRVMRAAF